MLDRDREAAEELARLASLKAHRSSLRTLTDEECDQILTALDEVARGIDGEFFGLPLVYGNEALRDAIRKSLG